MYRTLWLGTSSRVRLTSRSHQGSSCSRIYRRHPRLPGAGNHYLAWLAGKWTCRPIMQRRSPARFAAGVISNETTSDAPLYRGWRPCEYCRHVLGRCREHADLQVQRCRLPPLDVVVFNPSARSRGPFVELLPADVQRALTVTSFGGFLVGQQAARRMLPRRSGAPWTEKF
jgi:NAD(P)-dependent dehydrogenase (short-subunit alcohol dehydrogenase family)